MPQHNDKNEPTERPRADLGTLRRCVIAILLLMSLGVCYQAQEILVPIVLAFLLALLLSPIVNWLEDLRLPRFLGSFIVLVGIVIVLAAGVMSLSLPAQQWIVDAPARIRTIEQRLKSLREPLRQAQEATQKIEGLTQSTAPEVVTTQPQLFTSLAMGAPRALAAIAVVLLLVYFFLSSGNSFLKRVVEIAPGLSEKKVIVSIARKVQQEISRYLITISLINLALGAAVAASMALLGLPNPLLWGAACALLNFAPYVGPAISGAALLIAGLTHFDTLTHALAIPGTFFLIAFIEGQLITPTIIGKRLALDPTIVFIWLLIWGWLWGIVGILLAGPLLACFRIVCQHVDSLKSICILIGDGSSAEPQALGKSAIESVSAAADLRAQAAERE